MTGKEFFGKLLNNHQEEDASWDREESHDASLSSEVDVSDSIGHEQEHEPPPVDDRPRDDEVSSDEASYVDAPVTELRAASPDHFEVQDDANDEFESTSPQSTNEVHRERTPADYTEPHEADPSEMRPTEAERFQTPGGDGLTGDLPEVRPSQPATTESPTHLRQPEDEQAYHDAGERRAEDYLSNGHSDQQEDSRAAEPNVQPRAQEPAGEVSNYREDAPQTYSEPRSPSEEAQSAQKVGHSTEDAQTGGTHRPEFEPDQPHEDVAHRATNAIEPDAGHSAPPASEEVDVSAREHAPSEPAHLPAAHTNGALPPEQTRHETPVEAASSQPEFPPQPEAHHPVEPAQKVNVEPEAPPHQEAAPHEHEAQLHNEAPATHDATPPREEAVQPQAPPAEAPARAAEARKAEPPKAEPRAAEPPNAEPPETEEPKAPAPPTKAKAPKKQQKKDSDKDSDKAANVSDADVANIKDRVVQRLLEKNVVTVDQVKNSIADRSKQSLKATLWRIVAQQPMVDRERVYREAALTYAFVERKIDEGSIDVDFIRQVAEVFPEKKRNRLIELHIVPIGYEFEQQTQLLRVVFITHDPSLPVVRELMQDLNLERYELQYASETTVKDLLARAFPKKNEYLERMSDDPLAYDLGTSYEDEKSELIDEDALEAEINRSSLINLFEGALVEAVHRGASDIHIYPNARRQIEIHFRVDGRLLHWHTEDKIHPESMLAVIKDNTMNVDRFERDMAQDGFIQRKVDETLIRYRVSILPIATASSNIHAESIVIRVLDDRKVITDLAKLGLLKGALERFDMAIRQPHGMVILTGPTGSGKSTTLVAALHQVVTPEVNVLTVEDPVEYIIPGVRQIKLNHKLGLEGALRAILRHDPDVVMVGEMRDKATAELAVKLSNTGHLTFSTLHTNDAPSAVSRLYKMGVEPFLIAYAINLVVAQRLLRTLCPKCKVVDNDPDHVLLERLGFTEEDLREHTLFKASGDPTCKTCKGLSYRGRRAISEALYFSRDVRHMIVEADNKIDEDGLRDTARKEGMLTLQDSAREVVKMGETSVDEMMRVTMTEE